MFLSCSRHILLFVAGLSVPLVLFAAGEKPFLGATSASLGGIRALGPADSWRAFNNPAHLGFDRTLTAAIHWSRAYMLKGGDLMAATVSFSPYQKGAFNITGYYFGDATYNEKHAGIRYGQQLLPSVSIGVGIGWMQIQMPQEWGTRNTVVSEVGLVSELTEGFLLGAYIHNLFRGKISSYEDERLTAMMGVAVAYVPVEGVWVSAELNKTLENKPTVAAGIRYDIHEKLSVAAGLRVMEPRASSLSFGLESRYKQFSVGLAAQWHSWLGWTPVLSLSYQNISDKTDTK